MLPLGSEAWLISTCWPQADVMAGPGARGVGERIRPWAETEVIRLMAMRIVDVYCILMMWCLSSR